MVEAWQVASDIAQRLRQLRDQVGWTQEDLGRHVGRLRWTVSRWETGDKVPPRGVLERLAKQSGWPREMFAEGGPMPVDVLAGELEPEPEAAVRFMSSIFDWTTLEERRADLFALADLIPDRLLEALRHTGYSAGELGHWVYCEILRYAPGWPPARVRDRTALRIDLSS